MTSGTRLRKNRNRVTRLTDEPDKLMSSKKRPPTVAPAIYSSIVETVANWFCNQSGACERFAWTLRDSLDELLDGQRTGRWCYQQLKKTEKTYLGTAVEVNFTNEFEIPDGETLDWNVNGIEVDCKFSKDFGGWEIPMEMYLCPDHGEQAGLDDHVAMLLWMCDDSHEWAAGLTVITDADLRFKPDGSRQYNRDNKRRLSDIGLAKIHWLWGGLRKDLPANLLLGLDVETRTRILSPQSGQQRVNSLFREVQGKLVTRANVLTAAQQDDPMKRARDARLPKHLGREGFLVLGHQEADPLIAELLGLPIPVKGEFVSCRIRLADATDASGVNLDGTWWVLAENDASATPAPLRKLYKAKTREQLETDTSPDPA